MIDPVSPVMRDNVMTLARAFIKARGIKMRTLSRYIRGDEFFLDDFSHGRISVTIRKYDEIMQYFALHWPEDVPFPDIREFER